LCLLQELVDALLAVDLDEHYGVPLDFIALLHQNAGLANTLLQAPQSMLEVLEDALITAQARHGVVWGAAGTQHKALPRSC
jgi:hypothetical protein